MQKHPLQNNSLSLKNVTLVLTVLATLNSIFSQNSIVGDGFGGRLWYVPYNYTVGAYSAYTICGDDNQLFGWGGNEYGQLGDGTNIGHTTPTRAIGMTSVKYYSTGYLMGAIKFDKSGWVWGHLAGNKPVKVIDNVKFLDAGMDVCTFIKTDGTVWSVGSNRDGSFGNNLINESSTLIPQQMTGIKNAVRVANSGCNNIILLADGTVMQVGNNFNFSMNFLPEKVKGLSNIIDIKANIRSVIALDKFGDVYAWGMGGLGGLGNGTARDIQTPKKINGLNNIVAISGCNDGEHFLALDSNHNCYAWGYNGYGQCGVDESALYRPEIVAKNVNDILAGERFSYIIKTDGELYASGMSKDGSIWMNIQNTKRLTFTKINPRIPPIELCEPTRVSLVPHRTLKITICPSDSFKVGLHYYKKEGSYIDTIFNTNAFDTIVYTQIKLNKISLSRQTKTICNGNFIQIKNHSYYLAGFYKDTFKNSYGCDSILTTELKILPVSRLTNTITICEGEQTLIRGKICTKAGVYIDTFSNTYGCDSIITSTLIVNQNPIADFAIGRSNIEAGDTFQLLNLSIGADRFRWLFQNPEVDSSSEKQPFYLYKKGGLKTIRLISIIENTNCSDTILRTIHITENENIYIPNAFHPSENGLNGSFLPVSKSDKQMTMRIFNRWGLLLFETSQSNEGWNGQYENKDCPQDVYLYAIEIQNYFNTDIKHYSGTLTLLR